MIKQYTFEELPQVDDITIDLVVCYYYSPAKLDGLPEDCYPEEEEIDITPESGYEQAIMSAYVDAARLAIKQIDDQIAEIDGATVREWVEDARNDWEGDCEE